MSEATTTPPSRFLDLPAEMRNRIYAFALHHDRANDEPGAVNILRTCRQIDEESKELLFETSTFTIEVTTPFTKWCDPNSVTSSDSMQRQAPHIARTLAISGDFELCKRFDMSAGVPTANVYDALPAIMRRLKRINLIVEPLCVVTVQS